MPVNIEIKGNLARLLATENLIVEHKKVETAQFDTKSRVLTLPMWNTASNYVYDMLVAHEVGHALFTPPIMWKKDEYKDVPMSYVNVIEDARIERLMKQKFAGLNKDFYKGYEELNAIDFFELSNENINDMKLIDKINLYYKLGAYLCLEFNDLENEFVTQAAKTETFDDVLALSKRIYEYTKVEKQKRQQEQQKESQEDNNTEGGDTADLDTPSYKVSDDNGEDELEDDFEDFEGQSTPGKSWNDIEESSTQEAFDRNSDALRDKNGREVNYVNIPELNLEHVVVPMDIIHHDLKVHFSQYDDYEHDDRFYLMGNTVDAERRVYREYKKSASKDVNQLVKEFEMKKSADSYARQAVAKTGVLDTSKLHTYMFNEDIFKKVSVIPDGKNHGLVFLLDWSGSMSQVMKDTIKQLYNLVWFCRKCGIPFEVYAFTNDAWSIGDNNVEESPYRYDTPERVKDEYLVHELKENDLHIDGTFRMVNILTHTANTKQLDEMMELLWLHVSAFHQCRYHYYPKFALSGTPLNEAIIAVGQLTKQLIKRSKLQKCHVISLTDGEGFSIGYNHMTTKYSSNEPMMGVRSVSPWETVIRHKGKTFLNIINEPDFTCKLVEAVKSDIPNCHFIGIRILEKGGVRNFYSWYGRNSYTFVEDMQQQLRKDGVVHFESSSFDKWFAIPVKNMHVDDELEVEQGAAKRTITAAFRKMNKNKKTNKLLVKEFIKQIA